MPASCHPVAVWQGYGSFLVARGNQIVYVGDREGVKAFIGEDTEFVGLGGKMMLPGFVESHFHTTVGAAFGQGLWLAHLDENQDKNPL
jgi:predicted amidohydrolase YtcJ